MIIGGRNWYEHASGHGGDTLNGFVLMILGLAVGAGVLTWNVRKTSLAVGITGSIIHFGLFPFLSVPVVLLWAVGAFKDEAASAR